jgi:hypothetical protein
MAVLNLSKVNKLFNFILTHVVANWKTTMLGAVIAATNAIQTLAKDGSLSTTDYIHIAGIFLLGLVASDSKEKL